MVQAFVDLLLCIQTKELHLVRVKHELKERCTTAHDTKLHTYIGNANKNSEASYIILIYFWTAF